MFLVGLAVILALMFGLASAAFGANGQAWILGNPNVATAITKLAGAAGVNGPMLQLINNNAGANDTALDLRVQAGEAPMRVNSTRKVANLNADRIDNREASSFANGTGGVANNADKLDGKDSTGFQEAGAAAGGDLSGNYPNPNIANNAVTSAKIQDEQVQNEDIANSAVNSSKLGTNSVNSARVLDRSLTSDDIAIRDGRISPPSGTISAGFCYSNSHITNVDISNDVAMITPAGDADLSLTFQARHHPTDSGRIDFWVCNRGTSDVPRPSFFDWVLINQP